MYPETADLLLIVELYVVDLKRNIIIIIVVKINKRRTRLQRILLYFEVLVPYITCYLTAAASLLTALERLDPPITSTSTRTPNTNKITKYNTVIHNSNSRRRFKREREKTWNERDRKNNKRPRSMTTTTNDDNNNLPAGGQQVGRQHQQQQQQDRNERDRGNNKRPRSMTTTTNDDENHHLRIAADAREKAAALCSTTADDDDEFSITGTKREKRRH